LAFVVPATPARGQPQELIGILITGMVPPRGASTQALPPTQLPQIRTSNLAIQARPTVWRSIAITRSPYQRPPHLGMPQPDGGNAFVGTEIVGAAAALNALAMITLLTPP
jgi:hypothetical protein